MNRVLIIDDDQGLVSLLQRFLQNEGFQVRAVYDHQSGLATASSSEFDVVILDVMLPGGSGFELLKSLRATHCRTPVILLTARGESVDRILGLEIGADDYVSKPFDPRELVARIRAVLRRSQEVHGEGSGEESLTVGDISLSLLSRTATCEGQPVELTGAEFNMLELLLRRAGAVVTREELAQAALGRPLSAFDRSVDVHVSRLRKKLGSVPGGEERIRPVRGIGYFYAISTRVSG
ncbi:MAG: response regulator transcription factor [Acidobacteriota bacterium]|nr:response regulator transcription factor [Acidobacteriota bacterium]